MEMLISMTVISILMAASVPMLTQFSTMKTGVDKNVMKCITNNDSSAWYTTSTGNTTVPSTDPCKAAVSDVQYERGKAYNTAAWFAGIHGTAAQQSMARKILRAACDQGGRRACDYFINTCWKDGSTTGTRCDDTADFTDITYYVHQNATTNTNTGATYIYNQLETLLPKMIPNLVAEVTYACGNNQGPDDNQNLGSNLACELSKPWIYIKACNNGNTAACAFAYTSDYNRSCAGVKTVWSEAPTGPYKITYDSSGNADDVDCNMSSYASAAITGCNDITANLLGNAPDDDCTYGYSHGYNQTCNVIKSNWTEAPTGTYNLTTNGAPPTALISDTCTNPPPNHAACIASGIGTVCDDGTVYAGTVAGRYIFTTTTDESGLFYWNNGLNGILTGANNINDGKPNYDILIALSNDDSPYYAALACKSLNNGTSNFGHTDWYMPALNELALLQANRTAIGNYLGTTWASTEYNNLSARCKQPDGYEPNSQKTYSWYVRCVRYDANINASCPNVGDTCSDGTKYAGYLNSRHYFTTVNNEPGTYTWNKGSTTGLVAKGTIDANYGKPNTDTLIAATDSGAPYEAAIQCGTTLNTNTTRNRGYTDWYLPSRNELLLLYTNQTAIGNFSTTMWYESSTELSFYQVVGSRFSDNNVTINKYVDNRVRCVRSELP